MITRTQYANVNLVGDGVEKTVVLDLSADVKGQAKSVVSVSLRGPNPLPEVKGRVLDSGEIQLTFSEPLQKFDGQNGYTVFIVVEVK